jgi:hypothetical protein
VRSFPSGILRPGRPHRCGARRREPNAFCIDKDKFTRANPDPHHRPHRTATEKSITPNVKHRVEPDSTYSACSTSHYIPILQVLHPPCAQCLHRHGYSPPDVGTEPLRSLILVTKFIRPQLAINEAQIRYLNIT